MSMILVLLQSDLHRAFQPQILLLQESHHLHLEVILSIHLHLHRESAHPLLSPEFEQQVRIFYQ